MYEINRESMRESEAHEIIKRKEKFKFNTINFSNCKQ